MHELEIGKYLEDLNDKVLLSFSKVHEKINRNIIHTIVMNQIDSKNTLESYGGNP
jgi:hypothetical protein